MKNHTQVYVNDSFEEAELYCRAFGALITLEIKNAEGSACEHCELSVDGEGFLALSETKNPFNVAFIHKKKWETMTFNAFEMGSEAAVQRAFDALPWSSCCAAAIDRYGVCWRISI